MEESLIRSLYTLSHASLRSRYIEFSSEIILACLMFDCHKHSPFYEEYQKVIVIKEQYRFVNILTYLKRRNTFACWMILSYSLKDRIISFLSCDFYAVACFELRSLAVMTFYHIAAVTPTFLLIPW